MADIDLKQGEAKTIEVTVRDEDGAVINLTGATFTFAFKERNTPGAVTQTIPNADISNPNPTTGVITFVMTTTHTATVGDYVAELRIQFSATNIDKSIDLSMRINVALT
jgi:type IV secretory pathway component VirB8